MMNFVTNHDENSWNGTIKERMGDASELLTALSFVVPGMPLIYSDKNMIWTTDYYSLRKIKFRISKTMWPLLEKLGQLKNSSPALNGGKSAALYKKINLNNSKVLAFKREKMDKPLLFFG